MSKNIADSVGDSYIVVVPGALQNIRMWSGSNYTEIIKRLSVNTNYRIVLCGTPTENKLCKNIVCSFKSEQINRRIVNLSGKTTLLDFLGIIKYASLLIGNDSAAVHIASAMNTKSICILGGGHIDRFLPCQIRNYLELYCLNVCLFVKNVLAVILNCIYDLADDEQAPCISNISVDMVWNKVKEVLEL